MFVVALLAGCSSDYGLHAVSGGRVDIPPPPVGRVRAPRPDGSATTEVWTQGAQQVAVYDFGADAGNAQVDWLFVLDHSASMEALVDRVQTAFGQLAHEGVFPAQSRIGVLYTLPAGPDGRPHPAAGDKRATHREPGFLHLVSAERIAKYRKMVQPQTAARFPEVGCGEWFAPDDVGPDGAPCLVAHTRISGAHVGVEAGLHALAQWLEATPHPFRTGAVVNVVFVSDTHDPGTSKAPDLLEMPTFDDLQALAERDQPLAGFRLSGIVPEAPCGSEHKWPAGDTYHPPIEASGGWTLDACAATDYRPLIRQISLEGARPTNPVLALDPGAPVTRVEVDGQPAGFAISEDGRALVLDRLPAHRARIEVVRAR
jgi:hypothetical protein